MICMSQSSSASDELRRATVYNKGVKAFSDKRGCDQDGSGGVSDLR